METTVFLVDGNRPKCGWLIIKSPNGKTILHHTDLCYLTSSDFFYIRNFVRQFHNSREGEPVICVQVLQSMEAEWYVISLRLLGLKPNILQNISWGADVWNIINQVQLMIFYNYIFIYLFKLSKLIRVNSVITDCAHRRS